MTTHEVIVIGAGPVGLSAAANLVERGMHPLVLEAGTAVASHIRDWGHVRLFTPWSYLIDPAGARLLGDGWTAPDPDQVPLGQQLVDHYLQPLATALGDAIRTDHRVVSVSRVGHDRMKDGVRQTAPFLVVVDTPDGRVRLTAESVIDASGTWSTPNPMGAGGIPADGEKTFVANIRYGMPDVLGRERERYAGKRVLVVGSGHSAIGTVLAMDELQRTSPDTLVAWAIRGDNPCKLWGGGSSDQIKGRGALGTMVHDAVASGRVPLLTDLSIASVEAHPEGVAIRDVEGDLRVVVDEIIVVTGSRPNLEMHRELRLEIDPATEASGTLGPLIDPNHHSCGTVPPHGAEELAHGEERFFIVGMKSYGRAPTFLLRTGYEQARSVAAELAGDHDAARRVELELPQTGVCSTDLAYGGRSACC